MHKIKARIQYASENLEDSPTPFSGLKKALCSLAPSNSITSFKPPAYSLTLRAKVETDQTYNPSKSKKWPDFSDKKQRELLVN